MTVVYSVIKVMMAVLWTAFIISALVSAPSDIPKFQWLTFPGVDKVIHITLFLVEGFLVSWSILRSRSVVMAAMIVAFCVILGGGLELIQYQFIDGRSGDILDLLADAFGAVMGVYVFLRWSKK